MIKIDFDKVTIDGDMIVIATEIDSLFRNINQLLDKYPMTERFEEVIVCSDEGYKEFCTLAVRLNEAHKRATDIKRAYKDINK